MWFVLWWHRLWHVMRTVTNACQTGPEFPYSTGKAASPGRPTTEHRTPTTPQKAAIPSGALHTVKQPAQSGLLEPSRVYDCIQCFKPSPNPSVSTSGKPAPSVPLHAATFYTESVMNVENAPLPASTPPSNTPHRKDCTEPPKLIVDASLAHRRNDEIKAKTPDREPKPMQR